MHPTTFDLTTMTTEELRAEIDRRAQSNPGDIAALEAVMNERLSCRRCVSPMPAPFEAIHSTYDELLCESHAQDPYVIHPSAVVDAPLVRRAWESLAKLKET